MVKQSLTRYKIGSRYIAQEKTIKSGSLVQPYLGYNKSFVKPYLGSILLL